MEVKSENEFVAILSDGKSPKLKNLNDLDLA